MCRTALDTWGEHTETELCYLSLCFCPFQHMKWKETADLWVVIIYSDRGKRSIFSSGTLWLINIKCVWVPTRSQLCLLLPFSPRRCDVMSDKRQRARVQGSWAQQVPKHSGRTGHFRDDGYCKLTSARYSGNEIIICIFTCSSPGCWYFNILCLAKTFTKTVLCSVNVPDVENNFWF